ncbi:MAG: hypothetical protein BMS9Abin02_1729 [Anaerolineae bacterium]|nr:MAG: hypothetical protein BMS9Abin02_1729 [Anaerolineae bacterium]
MKRNLSRLKIARQFQAIAPLLVFIILVGCIPKNLQGPDPCNEGGTLFNDDFDQTKDCGWLLFNGRGITQEIADGALRISNTLSGVFAWANADRNFDDVIINVQSRQVSGPDDNAYGVICRYQSEENFYVFLISGDGHYAIGKYQSGTPQVQYLTGEGQYVFSEAINQGAAQNDIRASCIGNELSLAVNGIPLETVTDPTFVTGDIGLGASAFQPGTAVIEFDSIRVIAP